MSTDRMDLPQGTLDPLILKAVALEPQHGWAISQRLHQMSSDTLQIRQGSLYPPCTDLKDVDGSKRDGALREQPARQVRRIDTPRTLQLETQTDAWRKLTISIGRVLEAN